MSEQAKLTLKAVLTYDAEGMHSGDRDPEARDWFMFDVLHGGGLVLHDNKEIGDAIGTLSQVELVAHDDAAELRAAIREWSEANRACSQWVAGTVGNDEDELPLARLSRAERHLHALAASEGQP